VTVLATDVLIHDHDARLYSLRLDY